jgi:phosphoglycolate phosphatase
VRIHTIAFDFDLTLADTSLAVMATMEAVYRSIGLEFAKDTVNAITSNFSSGLDALINATAPPELAEVVKFKFLDLYAEIGISHTVAFPGVYDSISLLNKLSIRYGIVSAKSRNNLEQSISHLKLSPDFVYSGLHGKNKGRVIKAEGVTLYVGDDIADVDAGKAGEAEVLIITRDRTRFYNYNKVPTYFLSSFTEFSKFIQDWHRSHT